MKTATAISFPNIAFIKYWGNTDHALRIPSNGSISMNLAGLETRTTVRFDPALPADTLAEVATGEQAGALETAFARLAADQAQEEAAAADRLVGTMIGAGLVVSLVVVVAAAAAGFGLYSDAMWRAWVTALRGSGAP